MSERSGSPSSEGEGEQIRPYGEDRDSSEESEDDDPEEAKRIAEGFIVDEDDEDGDDDDGEEAEVDREARRKQRKEERKRRRRREKRARRDREQAELSEDELELLNENRGYGRKDRPSKRVRRESGSEEVEGGALKDMFADDEERMLDEDDDDLGDFIEDDDEGGVAGETEEERKARRREEKKKRREAAKLRPELAGVDRGTWDELFEVFGDGEDYDWALQAEEPEEREDKAKVALEDVFDPADIKERRLQPEDQAVQTTDRPERHQLLNSTLSDNPVLAPDVPFPDTADAAGYAFNKISTRTQYIFCGMHPDDSYPEPSMDPNVYHYPAVRRPDLEDKFKEAVKTSLYNMFVEHLEVPFLWHYQRNNISYLEHEGRSAVDFLERDELWALYELGIKFRAIHERVEQARALWAKVQARSGATDTYLEQKLIGTIRDLSVEGASDALDWLEYHYAADVRAIKEDEAMERSSSRRLPERAVTKDMRNGPIKQLVEAFGLVVSTVSQDFKDMGGQPHPPTDHVKMPLDVADEFAGPDSAFTTADAALQAAMDVLVTDFSKDPACREQAREFIRECADVTVTPTDRGMTIIDEYHSYWTFKFLTNKPIPLFRKTPQWLHILKAEEEGLVEVSIEPGVAQTEGFVGALERCCRSLDYGEVGTAWNELRKQIVRRVVVEHLIPIGRRWVKEHLRSQAEEFVAEECRKQLEFRVNMRPFSPKDGGEVPSVLALSNGRGDIRDAVIAVLLDKRGNILVQTKFDNLRDEADRESFMDLVIKKNPDVVTVGGMSVHTARVRDDAKKALQSVAARSINESAPDSQMYSSQDEYNDAVQLFEDRIRPFLVPLIMPPDATARLFMDSDEAKSEYPTLPPSGRYALAMARYTQNPLNSYARFGKKMLDMTFMEHHQRLISQERLLLHLERGLVNSVCAIGLDLWQCVSDPYARHMLPFVSGLGPRKADNLVKVMQRDNRNVPNRAFLFGTGAVPAKTFINSAGFLALSMKRAELEQLELEANYAAEQPDPLDMTRIHPEDYDLARKICQEAQDLDAEDLEGLHPSDVVLRLMLDRDRARKLGELNLDDFAFNLQTTGSGNERHTLGEIVNEIISHRADRRPAFYVPVAWEVLEMLSGETPRSIGRGMRVTANVRRVTAARAFCQLESGLDAILEREFAGDDGGAGSCEDVLAPRQSLKVVVMEAEPERMQVRISMRRGDLEQSVPYVQPFLEDPHNSHDRARAATEAAAAKKRRQAGKAKRVVNHPNWHVMNSGQAEQFLASQPRGEVVIRPSSKGPDHIALTFKLDEDVFQHVDVQEIDKPNEYSLGRLLRIGNKFTFNDLDDVIVNYVRAIMRMLEEAERHEKFKPEAELESWLKNTLLAFPNRSMYGFCLDSDRPGYLRLCFLNKSTKDGGVIQTWPVRLLPGAFLLNTAEVPGMNELCNAFKAQYSSKLADQGAGGKTPGIRAGRTPAVGGRTPGMGGMTPYGGRTPGMAAMGGQTPYGAGMAAGRTPVRPGMTPNPYGAGAPGPSRPAGYGGATPAQAYGAPPQVAPPPMSMGMPQGYQGVPPGGVRPPFPPPGPGQPQGYNGMPPPGPPGPPGGRAPPGINPERAAMIARQGGY